MAVSKKADASAVVKTGQENNMAVTSQQDLTEPAAAGAERNQPGLLASQRRARQRATTHLCWYFVMLMPRASSTRSAASAYPLKSSKSHLLKVQATSFVVPSQGSLTRSATLLFATVNFVLPMEHLPYVEPTVVPVGLDSANTAPLTSAAVNLGSTTPGQAAPVASTPATVGRKERQQSQVAGQDNGRHAAAGCTGCCGAAAAELLLLGTKMALRSFFTNWLVLRVTAGATALADIVMPAAIDPDVVTAGAVNAGLPKRMVVALKALLALARRLPPAGACSHPPDTSISMPVWMVSSCSWLHPWTSTCLPAGVWTASNLQGGSARMCVNLRGRLAGTALDRRTQARRLTRSSLPSPGLTVCGCPLYRTR